MLRLDSSSAAHEGPTTNERPVSLLSERNSYFSKGVLPAKCYELRTLSATEHCWFVTGERGNSAGSRAPIERGGAGCPRVFRGVGRSILHETRLPLRPTAPTARAKPG